MASDSCRVGGSLIDERWLDSKVMGKAILATDQDLLFGKIAVRLKYCTAGEVEKGFGLQAQSPDRLALGQILVGEGFITPEQHSEILTIQRRKSGEIEPVQEASKESVFLGKLAVRERLLTEENVNSCLRIQALEPERRSLGTIMVEQGFLAPKQLKALLALQ